MEISSTTTKQDHINYLKEYCLQHNRNGKLWGCFIVVFIFTFSAIQTFEWPGVLITGLITAIVMFSLVFAIPYTLGIMQLEKRFKQSNPNWRLISLTGDGITLTDDITTIYPMRNIKNVYSTKNYIGLEALDNSYDEKVWRRIVIPKHDFETPDDATRFFNALNSFAYRNTLNTNKKPPPPYAWGLLGIIPFVGGVNGVIMVIRGIFKYKSIAYTVLGAIGMVFTGVFISFYHSAPDLNNSALAKTYIDMSQKDLNELVKNIEFYKMQNNVYPDDLTQLYGIDNNISIYDPIYSYKTPGKNIPFYYKRIGDKYTLFSSGLDMKPHTADDIYPSLKITDSSKFGLVRMK